ncbi:MAG: 3-hydroxyacyl-ACP dehydratase FabZ [Candidatus Omnitrophica bacterium]|nr:3-hydroxyacyl-ACP dehydratase FabZ [Candidatus Omnitrophota bacterium]
MFYLDINKIKESLPQRYPVLLIDGIISINPRKKVSAIKNVSINETYFNGHFPDKPIMPGTLIIEAMAQTSTFLFYDPLKPKQKLNFFLGMVKDCRFFKPVNPGDRLEISSEAIRIAEDTAYVQAIASIKCEKVADGQLIFIRRNEE